MDTRASSRLDALLVGYENQENLGLRSIAAFLNAQGWRTRLVPFVPGLERAVVAIAKACSPRLLGFSLIFQYSLEEFAALLERLRSEGVRAHFTAGGHFPSLRPHQAFEILPQLDSIVRFEGEHTAAELLGVLDEPHTWDRIAGLAFRRGSDVVVNPARPLIPDLDSLPPVYRDAPREVAPGIKMASMLASRGCLFNCAFCSIRQFYSGAPGARRRVRRPEAVVEEMRRLHDADDVRFFSFQDDDFAAKTVEQRRWIGGFLDALAATRLADRVRWKISCRVDDLEPHLLSRMIEHGLAAVYLGVESGNETGLRTLNKRTSVAQNLEAVDLLKRFGLATSIGFMLFDPSSTVESVRENVRFLRCVADDGYFPVNFCQMLPYAGTPIETALRKAGRLTGSVTRPTYGFLDPRLDWYSFVVQRIFTRRNFSPDGILAMLQQADFEHRLRRSFGEPEPVGSYGERLRALVESSNRQAADTLDELLDRTVAAGKEGEPDLDTLLEDRQSLLWIAERQWKSENDVEVALRMLSAGHSTSSNPMPAVHSVTAATAGPG